MSFCAALHHARATPPNPNLLRAPCSVPPLLSPSAPVNIPSRTLPLVMCVPPSAVIRSTLYASPLYAHLLFSVGVRRNTIITYRTVHTCTSSTVPQSTQPPSKTSAWISHVSQATSPSWPYHIRSYHQNKKERCSQPGQVGQVVRPEAEVWVCWVGHVGYLHCIHVSGVDESLAVIGGMGKEREERLAHLLCRVFTTTRLGVRGAVLPIPLLCVIPGAD